jgi:rhodanese-related sulfurtransferase
VQRITPDEALRRLQAGEALLFDVRSAPAFASLHAAGAVSFPETDMAARIAELPVDKALVFYWTWPAEQQSVRVALYAIDQGLDLDRVYVLLGGLAAWREAGYPTETGGP